VSKNLRKLAESLNIKFKDMSLLDLAVTHRSYVHEQKMPLEKSNERLEFLGDAVLGICIAEMLVKDFPEEPEGVLSKRRAALVNQKTLAKLAQSLELGTYLKLGKGEEKTGGRTKRSLLCDAFEAVIGAIYLDQGIHSVARYLNKMFKDLIPESRKVETSQDYKTRLQEFFQAQFKKSPRYSVVGESGPDHSKTFQVKIEHNGMIVAKGIGSSKREAEQDAAKNAFIELKVSEKALDEKKKKRKRRKKKKKKKLKKRKGSNQNEKPTNAKAS
jgi:ribonuclease III